MASSAVFVDTFLLKLLFKPLKCTRNFSGKGVPPKM